MNPKLIAKQNVDFDLKRKVNETIDSLKDRVSMSELIREGAQEVIEEVYRAKTTFPRELSD